MSTYFLTCFKKFLLRTGIGLFPLKDKKFRRKKALALVDKKYMKRYLYALDNLNKKTGTGKSNIIWTCWLQGEENAPPLVQACLRQMRRINPDKQVVIITSDNIRQYADIPAYIYEKWQKGRITNTHFSDILRVSLLYEHGGIWLDATVYQGGKIPDDILSAPFFAYHSKTFLRCFPQVVGNNSWFLSAVKQHPLMAGMRALLFEYWRHENKLIHYFVYHLFFDLMVENNRFCRELWEKAPLYYDDETVEALHENLLRPFDENLFRQIIDRSPIQKLSYKYTAPETTDATFEKFIISQ